MTYITSVTFTTAGVPVISNVTIDNVTETSARANFTAKMGGGAFDGNVYAMLIQGPAQPVTADEIILRTWKGYIDWHGHPMSSTVSPEQSFDLGGMLPGTEYTVYIAAEVFDKTIMTYITSVTFTTLLYPADYTALDAALAAATLDETDYTAASWDVLAAAVAAGEAVDRNLPASGQSIIDDAAAAINDAIAALVHEHNYVMSASVSSTNLQNNTTVTITVIGKCSKCGDEKVFASVSVKLKQSGTQTVKVGGYDVTVAVNSNNKITDIYIGSPAPNTGGNQNGNSQGDNSNKQ
jgi:hypothetical protein